MATANAVKARTTPSGTRRPSAGGRSADCDAWAWLISIDMTFDVYFGGIGSQSPIYSGIVVPGRISPRFDIFSDVGSRKRDRPYSDIGRINAAGRRRIDGAQALPYKPPQLRDIPPGTAPRDPGSVIIVSPLG